MLIKKKALPSPAQIRQELPLSSDGKAFIAHARRQGQLILEKKSRLFAGFIGPCSIHDPLSAIEYGARLQKLSSELRDSWFLAMRVFIEKPRTQLGWKGFLYDPHLDGSHDLTEGIRLCRKLFLKLSELQIPCACELLDPLIIDYFSDLISWGFVGARTSASPIHRQMASGAPFPVGFKNSTLGEIDTAVAAVVTSRAAHCHIGLNKEGRICSIETPGNPWTHIVLRGSDAQPNFDPKSVAEATSLLKQNGLPSSLVIDCAHGNSQKDPLRQKEVFLSAIAQASEEESAIIGVMIESHLFAGQQPVCENPQNLSYGVSITDSCLNWEETEALLRSSPMCSVQK
ncbi:MAG TPA: 3-deoxy-7-phosphoheptulonate synthase [Parachlamydiales bacterium]|nr:3-deoxy-7-phosphoheptulonate synthase [Parachlamydiales bacterium]